MKKSNHRDVSLDARFKWERLGGDLHVFGSSLIILYLCISTNSIGNDTWWILFFRIQSSSIRITEFNFSVILVVYITEKNGC